MIHGTWQNPFHRRKYLECKCICLSTVRLFIWFVLLEYVTVDDFLFLFSLFRRCLTESVPLLPTDPSPVNVPVVYSSSVGTIIVISHRTRTVTLVVQGSGTTSLVECPNFLVFRRSGRVHIILSFPHSSLPLPLQSSRCRDSRTSVSFLKPTIRVTSRPRDSQNPSLHVSIPTLGELPSPLPEHH